MAAINSIGALKEIALQKMTAAHNEARAASFVDLEMEVGRYYNGTVPDVYIRTGTLMESPDVSPVSKAGNSVEFEAKMDDSISYSTGTYNGSQVITATNEGTSGTIGNHGYWERAKEEMKENTISAYSQYFSR